MWCVGRLDFESMNGSHWIASRIIHRAISSWIRSMSVLNGHYVTHYAMSKWWNTIESIECISFHSRPCYEHVCAYIGRTVYKLFVPKGNGYNSFDIYEWNNIPKYLRSFYSQQIHGCWNEKPHNIYSLVAKPFVFSEYTNIHGIWILRTHNPIAKE